MFEESAVTTFSSVCMSTTKEEPLACGGEVKPFTAASALNVGDPVFLNSSARVAKSGTAADYVGFIGVVVGGAAMEDMCDFSEAAVGKPACTAAGEKVWVAVSGIVYVVSSAALATIGARVGASASSGKVGANTTAGQIFGVLLETADGADEAVKVFLRYS